MPVGDSERVSLTWGRSTGDRPLFPDGAREGTVITPYFSARSVRGRRRGGVGDI